RRCMLCRSGGPGGYKIPGCGGVTRVLFNLKAKMITAQRPTAAAILFITIMSFSLGSSSAARAADSGSGAAAPRQDFPPISIAPGPYSNDLNSFKQYKYPDWFH